MTKGDRLLKILKEKESIYEKIFDVINHVDIDSKLDIALGRAIVIAADECMKADDNYLKERAKTKSPLELRKNRWRA